MTRSSSIAALAALVVATPAQAIGPVRSMLEMRREGVVRQGWDLSCGAAALSTLLADQHGDRVGEKEIVDALLRTADADRIRARGGFSLLDLKRYATSRGYAAQGYAKLDLRGLQALGPAIVATQDRAGPHFMVYRGTVRGRVFLADPAYGNRTMSPEHFEKIWSPRVAFVVRRTADAPALAGGEPPLVPTTVIRDALGGTR